MLLNRKIVKDLRSILDDALNDNESLEQFIVDIGNANFNDTEVTFKVNLRLKGAKSQSQKDLEGVQPKQRFYSHTKHLYAKANDVPNLLVDDRPHNLRAFEQQGGVGLRYQADESNYDKLITKLEKELY